MANVKIKANPVSKEVKQSIIGKKNTPLGFAVTSHFFGYNAKSDPTNLPPGYLVSPSRNVITNTAGFVQSRPGYVLDGQAGTANTGILGSYDFIRGSFGDQHLRYGNGKLQYRYIANGGDVWSGHTFIQGQVYWIDVLSGLPVDHEACFTKYFDFTSEKENLMLMVDGDSSITEWSGGVTTLKTTSNASILGQGTIGPLVIEIVCGTGVTSLSGSTTTAGNSVVTGSYVNTLGQTIYGGFIIMPNNPADTDTLTLVINGTTIVNTFLNALTYDYNQLLIGATTAETVNNLYAHLRNPSYTVGGFIANLGYSAFTAGQQPLVQLSTYNSAMNIQGTFTTAGNSVQTNTAAASILMPNNPANGDVLTLNLNGVNETITFVSVLLAVPNTVLIAGNAAATEVNLLGLLQHPGTTNATQVAFSASNQAIINSFVWSSTNTITLNGTKTWAQLGFYTLKNNRSIVINGNTYTYSGGETTNTITGVLPNPTSEPVHSVIHQLPITTLNADMTDLPSTFQNDIIGTLGNQVYVGSTVSNVVYLSKINNYTNYSQNTPRQPGDGFAGTVDGLCKAISAQETTMYVSWGDSGWTTFDFNLSADLMNETVVITPLKVAPLQTAISQSLVCNIGNDLAFVTHEPTFSVLGRVANNLATPQITNYSDSIKNDMDSYTPAAFVNGQSIYTKYFIYVSVPQLGIVRKYNINQGWWDSPFNLPVAKFSYIDGQLYGHSYLTDESYVLETGTNDNGNPINSIAAFSYDNFEDRVTKKVFNEWYVEGYISANTTLDALTKFDFGGFSGISTYEVIGTNTKIIFQTIADGSLGRNPIGANPIGSVTDSILNLPKFRVIFTGIPIGFFEYQPFFETNDIDFQWALIGFGPRIQTGNAPTEIRI